jgi:D-alanine-D-alanine ligase
MTRQTVLLLFGGESTEHDVSITSARNVYAACDNEKYDIKLCYIDKSGHWWLLDSWTENPENHRNGQLFAALGARGFLVVPSGATLHIDVILPILHGKNGEDGTVQGLAQLLHIPIVGCDVTASATAMDKTLTKQVLEANGIKTVEFEIFNKGDQMPDYHTLVSKFGNEHMFVKPARSGSSVGVSKVHHEAEFLPALENALQYDSRVVIERAVVGRELETAVLGNPPHHRVSGIGEIIPGAEFYDYNDKYAANSTSQVKLDAALSPELTEHIRATSKKAYEVLGCSGLARIDYLLEDDVPYVIEVNTIPGFTNISMYPKLWREAGVRYAELIDTLIESALK